MEIKDIENVGRFEIFLPTYSLQGDTIPFYITWKGDDPQISIIHSPDLKIESLLNAKKDDIEIENTNIIIKSFSISGYLGGKFHVNFDKVVDDKNAVIEILIEDEPDFSFRRTVHLFRPKIEYKISKDPIEIRFQSNKNKGKRRDNPFVRNPIRLNNAGDGTAIIGLEIMKESTIKESPPDEFMEILEGIRNDLVRLMKSLSEEFPEHSKIITDYTKIVKTPLAGPKEEDATELIESNKDIIKGFENALDSNEDFKDKFTEGVLTITLKYVGLVVDLKAFIAYLKSIGPFKVLITNPLTSLTVPKGQSRLLSRLHITDLSRNDYETIDLGEIGIESDSEDEIELYKLISFKREGEN